MKKQTKFLVAGLAGLGYLLLKKPQTKPVGSLDGAGLIATANIGEILFAARKIVRDLGASVDQAARLVGVPKWLILAIAAYEIRLFPYDKVNPAVGATGVMQVTPVTCVDALYFADHYKMLTPAVVAVLQKYLGTKNWPTIMAFARDRSAKGKVYFPQALKQPEFNILMGTLILKTGLIQHVNSDGKPNLAKVVLQYNQGFTFGRRLQQKTLLDASDRTIEIMAPRGEGKLYVSNMTAPGGVLDSMQAETL